MKTREIKRPSRFIVLILAILITLPSCALLTSYKKYTLQRAPQATFQNRIGFSDNFSKSIIFYDDGSCLFIRTIDPNNIDGYLSENNYKIYGRISDYHFYWGVYKVNPYFIEIEFIESVHQ